MKIYEAMELLKENKISPRELIKATVDNIKEKEPDIGAYITLCENSFAQEEKNRGNLPLWGIPLAIKDNICTKGVLTTAGSKMLSGFIPPYNATVVEKLKENGAIIIGKTNLDEFGMGSECSFSAFGATKNPINYEYVPGGSSGGSAAAVECSMALGALGTDTGGSIRLPAAFCGLYGLKPTYSLVSRYGLIEFASSLDTIGPICKSAKDCAIILDAIAGFDKKDATSARLKKQNYYENINTNCKNIKIGIPKEFFDNAQADIKNAVLRAAENYKSMGALVEECSVKSLKYALGAYYIISSAEASSNLARYDGVKYTKRCGEYKNLEEMYVKTRSENFGDEVKRRILLGTFVLSRGYYDRYYLKAKRAQEIIKTEFEELFEKYDVLLTPVCPVGVWKKGEKEKVSDIYKNDVCTSVVNLANLPAIAVPCGRDKNNMPVGFQLIGNLFGEQTLLNMAAAFEEGGFNGGI